MEKYPSRRHNGNIWVGFLFLLVGTGLIIQHLHLALPFWLFSWKTLLIVIGLFAGARHGFRGIGWLIPILIGGIFLTEDFFPFLQWRQYTWPVAFILIGLFLIARPRRDWRSRKDWNWRNYAEPYETKFSNEDAVYHTAIFGSVEKTILSKDFHGGSLTTVFGGTELNLIQADINGKAILDVTCIFGGTKLIVPSNWEIKSEMVAIFGGVEDKRPTNAPSNPEKVLILRGTTMFGGIEIVSY